LIRLTRLREREFLIALGERFNAILDGGGSRDDSTGNFLRRACAGCQ
jgi:hypothetical protein